jgi:hypothetical protein
MKIKAADNIGYNSLSVSAFANVGAFLYLSGNQITKSYETATAYTADVVVHKRMKKTLRHIKILILTLVVLILVFVLGFIGWHKFSWSIYIEKYKVMELSELVNKSEALPDNFYHVYDKLFPNQRHTRVLKSLMLEGISGLFNSRGSEKYYSPTRRLSNMIYMAYATKNKQRIESGLSLYFSFALDKYTTPEKCFDYYVHHQDFAQNRIGIRSVSVDLFSKEIKNLSDTEIIELILLLENPIVYNRNLHPDNVKKEMEKLYNTINE